jgi:hypothetical protein
MYVQELGKGMAPAALPGRMRYCLLEAMQLSGGGGGGKRMSLFHPADPMATSRE